MGPAQIWLKISARIAKKGDLSNATTFNPPLFSLVNTFKLLSLKFSNKSVQVNSNLAIGALPTLQISLGIVALFEKIYYVRFLPPFQISGRMYNTVVLIKCMM
jgi:hypothetical protein